MKEFKCKDAGHACDWKARGETEEELLRRARQHGREQHGLRERDIKPEELRKLIHEIA